MTFTDFFNADPDAQQSDDFDPPPDGTYTVALVDTFAGTSKAGNHGVMLTWKVVDVAHNDHQWKVWLGTKSPDQASITKRSVRDLGVDVDQIDPADGWDGVDLRLVEVRGRYFQVTVKTNGKFRNTYVDGPAEGVQTDLPAATSAESGYAPAAAAPTDDTDIPF